jgi:hypothetical protein
VVLGYADTSSGITGISGRHDVGDHGLALLDPVTNRASQPDTPRLFGLGWLVFHRRMVFVLRDRAPHTN